MNLAKQFYRRDHSQTGGGKEGDGREAMTNVLHF